MRALAPSFRPLQAAAATALIALAAALAQPASAFAFGPPGGHGHGGPGGFGEGPGMMMGGLPGGRMLDAVGASAEQKAQIRQIMEAARTDLRALHESGRALRGQAELLFTQPTVDANAVETLRQQMMAQADQASKRMAQAMIDASRVLSAEQRQQLAEHIAKRRTMMERHRAERQSLDAPPAPRQ